MGAAGLMAIGVFAVAFLLVYKSIELQREIEEVERQRKKDNESI